MTKTSNILFFTVICIITVLISLNLPPKQKHQEQSVVKDVLQKNMPILSLSADKKQYNTQTIQVSLTQYPHDIRLIQLEMGYDPLTLNAVQITPGNFFNNQEVRLETMNNNTGRISYAITCKTDPCITGYTNIAAITFVQTGIISHETTNITFLPKTVITNKEGKQIEFSTTNTLALPMVDMQNLRMK